MRLHAFFSHGSHEKSVDDFDVCNTEIGIPEKNEQTLLLTLSQIAVVIRDFNVISATAEQIEKGQKQAGYRSMGISVPV